MFGFKKKVKLEVDLNGLKNEIDNLKDKIQNDLYELDNEKTQLLWNPYGSDKYYRPSTYGIKQELKAQSKEIQDLKLEIESLKYPNGRIVRDRFSSCDKLYYRAKGKNIYLMDVNKNLSNDMLFSVTNKYIIVNFGFTLNNCRMHRFSYDLDREVAIEIGTLSSKEVGMFEFEEVK